MRETIKDLSKLGLGAVTLYGIAVVGVIVVSVIFGLIQS